MATFAVVTDSAANSPKAVADDLSIRIVTLMVNLEGKACRDIIVGKFGRTRSKPKAVEMMMEHMTNEVGGRTVHADVLEEGEALTDRVTEQFTCAELHVVEFTPGMGARTDPGVLGLAFKPELIACGPDNREDCASDRWRLSAGLGPCGLHRRAPGQRD